MLTEHQRDEFERVGVVRLTGIFGPADAARMSDRVWEALAREHATQRDEPATWTIGQPTGFQAVTRSDAFDALGSPVLTAALDDLLGEGGWERPKHWGSPLVKFPARAASWDVPSAQWHLDRRGARRVRCSPYGSSRFSTASSRAPAARSFWEDRTSLVERLAATGAPTGGHSRDVRRVLARMDPWLHGLWSAGEGNDRVQRFIVEGAVIDGVAVRVLELSGAPGDAFLMHPWQLHAPAPNAGTSPRLVLAHSVVRVGWTPE